MQDNENPMNSDHSQTTELSAQEQQMLRNYLDLERKKRWGKITDQAEKKDLLKRRLLNAFKWVAALVGVGMLIMVLWQQFMPPAKSPKPPATFATLVDYPFMEQQVRSIGVTPASVEVWRKCVAQYQKGDFAAALETSNSLDNAFFRGMCLLQLKQYEAAAAQFVVAPNAPDFQPEIPYYKAFALLQLGQKDEAKALLTQALARSDLRDRWKKAAEELLQQIK